MKKLLFKSTLMSILFCIFVCNILYSQEIVKSFKPADKIEIKIVSGDCFISKSNSGEIKVRVVYTYSSENYKPEFEESSGTLKMSENFSGNHNSGSSKWYIETPEKTDISFSSASGDLKVDNLGGSLTAKAASGNIKMENIAGEVKVSTASGNINAKNIQKSAHLSTASGEIIIDGCGGEIKASTASGEIEAKNLEKKIELSTASGHVNVGSSKGEFKLSCASGDVKADGIIIEGASKFATASGSVYVKLSKSAEFDMKLASASGDVKLDYNGNPVIGSFEFTANAEKGSILCPIKFDKEEKYTEHGQEYIKKTFMKGKDKPFIKIATSSGEAALKE